MSGGAIMRTPLCNRVHGLLSFKKDTTPATSRRGSVWVWFHNNMYFIGRFVVCNKRFFGPDQLLSFIKSWHYSWVSHNVLSVIIRMISCYCHLRPLLRQSHCLNCSCTNEVMFKQINTMKFWSANGMLRNIEQFLKS